jgi:hypothetical protein
LEMVAIRIGVVAADVLIADQVVAGREGIPR